jgi:predicted dehydrogenase
MKIALLGVSHWHTPLFLSPLLEEVDVEIVGVSDADVQVALRYAEKLACKAFSSYADLCEECRPDFVFALAPHADMHKMADFLIEAGIPFAIEKPVGISEEQVARLVEKAEAARHFVAIPFVFRYSGFFETLAQIAANETVHYAGFRFIAGPPSRYIQAGCSWMLDPSRSGGGSGINLGVHFLDMCRLLWPDAQPEVVSALVSNSSAGTGVEDHSLIALGAGQRRCLVETGYLYPAPVGVFDMHFSVRTDRHYIAAHRPGEIEISDMDGNRRVVAATTTNMPHYPTFVSDTLARLKAGRAPIADLNDMRAVMHLIDQAYRLSGSVPASGHA